ncbi:MAG: hypothetical protein DSO07_02745 [Thermoproteota archaeon]|nr:MAG: hypothetical protein DSO07_02745 [Candidatus Korarchaeota archaeon]
MLKRLDRHEEQLVKLREDMNRGFELIERRISALGARWGLQTEKAFREGLKGILEKEFGVKIERWIEKDKEGMVYDHPSDVELDVVKDGKTMLIEVSSHVKASDIPIFRRKAEFYEKVTGVRADRLVIVTPYADDRALEMAKEFGIEIYTKV